MRNPFKKQKKETREPTIHDFSGTLGQRIRAVRETKEYGATDNSKVSRVELNPRKPSQYDYNRNTHPIHTSGNIRPDDTHANVSRGSAARGGGRMGTMIQRGGAKTLTGRSVVADREDKVLDSGSD